MRSPFDSTEPWATSGFLQPEIHAQSRALAALSAPTERDLPEAAPSTQRSLELGELGELVPARSTTTG